MLFLYLKGFLCFQINVNQYVNFILHGLGHPESWILMKSGVISELMRLPHSHSLKINLIIIKYWKVIYQERNWLLNACLWNNFPISWQFWLARTILQNKFVSCNNSNVCSYFLIRTSSFVLYVKCFVLEWIQILMDANVVRIRFQENIYTENFCESNLYV